MNEPDLPRKLEMVVRGSSTTAPRATTRGNSRHHELSISLVEKAKKAWDEFQKEEIHLLACRDRVLQCAWRLGAILWELRQNVGRGDWFLWLDAHFEELGRTERMRHANAARCIRFFRDNPNSRNSCCNFTVESVRKLMWGYVPKKERPHLLGDFSDKPAPHYLTFVNEFAKYLRHLELGLAEAPPVEAMRRDFQATARALIKMLGPDFFRALLDE